MRNFILFFLILAFSPTSFSLVTVGDASLYAGFISDDSYVGANHAAKVLVLPINLETFTRENVEDLFECEFQSLAGENVAFYLRFIDGKISDATCGPAPADNYRTGWKLLLQKEGI